MFRAIAVIMLTILMVIRFVLASLIVINLLFWYLFKINPIFMTFFFEIRRNVLIGFCFSKVSLLWLVLIIHVNKIAP
jgi:hypothetical protein